jgi:hypothetical protein
MKITGAPEATTGGSATKTRWLFWVVWEKIRAFLRWGGFRGDAYDTSKKDAENAGRFGEILSALLGGGFRSLLNLRAGMGGLFR